MLALTARLPAGPTCTGRYAVLLVVCECSNTLSFVAQPKLLEHWGGRCYQARVVLADPEASHCWHAGSEAA